MIHLTLLCVTTLSSIALNFGYPVATSAAASPPLPPSQSPTSSSSSLSSSSPSGDPSVTEYTTDDVEYEDDPDVQVTTKSGLIMCNISNSMTQLPGYNVQMSFVEEVEAETTAREYIGKYKLVGDPVKHGPSESVNQWHFRLPNDECIKTPDGLIKFSFSFMQATSSTIDENVTNDIGHTNLTPGWTYFVEYTNLNEV